MFLGPFPFSAMAGADDDAFDALLRFSQPPPSNAGLDDSQKAAAAYGYLQSDASKRAFWASSRLSRASAAFRAAFDQGRMSAENALSREQRLVVCWKRAVDEHEGGDSWQLLAAGLLDSQASAFHLAACIRVGEGNFGSAIALLTHAIAAWAGAEFPDFFLADLYILRSSARARLAAGLAAAAASGVGAAMPAVAPQPASLAAILAPAAAAPGGPSGGAGGAGPTELSDALCANRWRPTRASLVNLSRAFAQEGRFVEAAAAMLRATLLQSLPPPPHMQPQHLRAFTSGASDEDLVAARSDLAAARSPLFGAVLATVQDAQGGGSAALDAALLELLPVLDAVADGSEVQLDGRSIADWERYRDDCLMAVQAAIKATKLKHGIAPDA